MPGCKCDKIRFKRTNKYEAKPVDEPIAAPSRAFSSNEVASSRNGLESEFVAVPVASSLVQPWDQIFALADIEQAELVTAFDHNFYSVASDSHTATDRQFSKRCQMQADTSQRRIRHRRAAER